MEENSSPTVAPFAQFAPSINRTRSAVAWHDVGTHAAVDREHDHRGHDGREIDLALRPIACSALGAMPARE